MTNLAFGERWEDGREIRHSVDTRIYWRDKLKREITRAVAIRDRKSVAELVKFSVLLKNPTRETNLTSQAMMSLVGGIASITPNDPDIRGICTEYLSKLPRNAAKADHCREILKDVCGKIKYGDILEDAISEINDLAHSNNFTIRSMSELRISKDLFRDGDEHLSQRLTIFRTDPTSDILISPLMPFLETGDWIHLINRVDRIQDDLESWKCLDEFLASDKMTDEALVHLKNYVRSYWPQYHEQIEVPASVQAYRRSVLEFLEL